MGRDLHGNWEGYIAVRENGRIIAAKCKICNKVLKKRDKAALAVHQRRCINAQDENDQNSSNKEVDNSSERDADSSFNSISDNEYTKAVQVPIKDKSIKNEERNIALLKFFLFHDLEFEKMDSVYCKNLFKTFDGNFTLPSSHDFQNKIFKTASDNILKQNLNKNYINAMHVIIFEDDKIVSALATLIAKDDNSSYVNYMVVRKEIDSNISYCLEEFCNTSVQKCKELYNVDVKFVLYDGTYDLQFKSTVNDIPHFRVKEFSCLMKSLQKIEFVSVNSTDLPAINKFYNTLDTLDDNIKSKNLKIADAIEELFKLIESGTLIANEHLMLVILENLPALYLACNYFHPKFQGNLFRNHAPLFTKFEQFWCLTGPVDAFDGCAYYHDRNGPFHILFEDQHDMDCNRFWGVARRVSKSLSEYALNLFYLPATFKTIDMKELVYKFTIYSKGSDRFKALILSVALEEL